MNKQQQQNRQTELLNLSTEYQAVIQEFITNYITLTELNVESWYAVENENLTILAELLHIPQNLLTAIVAAISPLCKWTHNIKWAVDIVQYCQGNGTYPNQGIKRNCDMAIAMYKLWQTTGQFEDNDAMQWLGQKTGAFFNNLLYPDASLAITVDVWICRLVKRQWQSATQNYKVRQIELDAMRHAIMQIWIDNDYNAVGIMPHNLQAALWVKIKNIKIASQWFFDFETITRFT